MTKSTRGRSRRGTLNIIAGLLIASAFVRGIADIGPALANNAPDDLTEVMTVPDTPTDTASLVEAFQQREARLAAREASFRDRMQALRVAEIEIEEKLEELRRAEESLLATIALAETAAATDLGQLTSVYENMKPKEAAALFEEMPPEFAAGFLGMMRPDAAALIMTQLAPETAYSFSVVLAGRNANAPTQ
ncbi:magnesium transporter MgtE N-terminal domain-containing protein [Yoonia sp. SS1-5]|uniref:Magnesium transporter MgtE N-terminal domain-containing protein n=1 Tax=Yoonia rhodophyticola TaxID=3137370 RepID=A0AAN0MB87_9RHOB